MSSIKLISAADTQYAGSLLKSFSDQRNNGLFCDITIIVQSRTFKAHRNILSASSTYFHQLFSVAGQIIELNFIKAEIFEVILNYIYSAKITRVRSDILEDLIKSGRILGVKFIASLGHLLSQVKGLPNLSKDEAEGDAKKSQHNTEHAPEKKDLISRELGPGAMPIITEAFSLSAEEFKGDSYKDVGSDNDDVLFVSKQGPKKMRKHGSTKESCKPSAVIDVDESSSEAMDSEEEETDIPETSSTPVKEERSIEKKDQKLTTEKVEEGKIPKLNSSSQAQPESTFSSSHMEQEHPDTSKSLPHSPASSLSGDSSCSHPLPPQIDGSPKELCNISLSRGNHEVIGVQKKQISTVLEASTDRPGVFKIKLSDIGPAKSPETIMFEKDSEMDLVSSGSKDSENFGEDTYDISDKPSVGASKAKRGRKTQSAPNSPGTPPLGGRGKKKVKVGMDDHYELIMDGKTFYVCVVCKRPYVCLTSLRRHFNVHSWEKKYPCHYCEKVFPLAEYRTKHEIQHTGERRYQCLLCSAFFMNYQLLSTHCKQVHNEDPSGRKEREYTDNNLYRLLPCKTLEIKSYSYVPEGKIPMINEDGIVYHVDPMEGLTAGSESPSNMHGRMMNWDDIFVDTRSQVRSETSVNPAEEDTPEFEFIIPETY